MADPQARHWSLDRTINIGHILTTLSMVVLAFAWGVSVETRLTEHAVYAKASTDAMRDMSVELKALNQRIETLIELVAYQRGVSDAQQQGRR